MSVLRAAAAASLLLAGCGLPDFDPAQYVSGLRVLGVKAEPPEVAQGGTTHLQPLAVNLDGSAIDGAWDACTEGPAPGGPPVNPDCLTHDSAPYLVPLGGGLAIDATIPSGLGKGAFGLPDGSDGIYLALRLRAHDASDQLDAVYRLRIANGLTVPNHNPSLSEIDAAPGAVDGGDNLMVLDEATPLEVHAGDTLSLFAHFADASAESYPVIDTEGKVTMKTELLAADWFASAGSFKSPRTGDGFPTDWTADAHLPAEGSTIDLWVVGRDERGGTDFAHRQLILR